MTTGNLPNPASVPLYPQDLAVTRRDDRPTGSEGPRPTDIERWVAGFVPCQRRPIAG